MKTFAITTLACAAVLLVSAGPAHARDHCGYGGGHHHGSSWGISFGVPLFYSYPRYSYYGYPAYGYSYAPRYYNYYPSRVSSPDVDVQIALARRGYDVGVIDGIIGPRTRAALRAFQATRGLPVTGVVDYPTMRLLGLR